MRVCQLIELSGTKNPRGARRGEQGQGRKLTVAGDFHDQFGLLAAHRVKVHLNATGLHVGQIVDVGATTPGVVAAPAQDDGDARVHREHDAEQEHQEGQGCRRLLWN